MEKQTTPTDNQITEVYNLLQELKDTLPKWGPYREECKIKNGSFIYVVETLIGRYFEKDLSIEGLLSLCKPVKKWLEFYKKGK